MWDRLGLARVERPLPDSNRGWRICNPLAERRNPQAGKEVTETAAEPLAQTLAQETPIAPDLARVVAAWPDLPPHIRAAVLALVGAAPRGGA